ncbi:MAG: tRNA (adenosine(37)-N6)-dimethylallyltransferase MiaA [Victivallaceae bacterium]|nr:tRNA (adenosine(37)-N6)-dimethylallyltransferase MiaA [Victivallaceae bacterium]
MTGVLAIMGPTASGKSALALECARRFNGEIVSVDSMQVYRGLEIGTSQPTAAERREIPHHLVGFMNFSERLDVHGFCELADKAIFDIASRGRLPILAGGTGFYFKSLFRGLDDLPADRELRTELDAMYDSDEGEPALVERLRSLDPAACERWRKCRRKMIRALEVRLISGRSMLDLQTGTADALRYDVAGYVIEHDPDVLRERISLRTHEMLASGWEEEARTALSNGLLESPTAWQALGYRQLADYLAGKTDRDGMISGIVTSTAGFARRQRTWFRHQHPECARLPWTKSAAETIARDLKTRAFPCTLTT